MGSGLGLQYADKSLKKDKSIVLAAIKKHWNQLQYADESLKKDPEIIKASENS